MNLFDEMIQKKLNTVFEDNNIIYDKSRFAGGLTNYNYIMEIHGEEYVIRQPGGMTNLMIDRHIEMINSNIASQLGINSDCICFDEMTGIKISRYIKNSRNLALVDPGLPLALESVSDMLKKLHSSPTEFPNRFDWKKELIKYEKIVRHLKGDFFFDYKELKLKLFQYIKDNLKKVNLVPCHNDTVPENFIMDEKSRTYLIDWEYSGMNDPSWDIAAYILESRLTEEAITHLLLNYYNKLPDQEELMKLRCYMMAQDLLWTVWALIRHYNGDDFLDYCSLRYERLRRNIRAVNDNPKISISDMVKYE